MRASRLVVLLWLLLPATTSWAQSAARDKAIRAVRTDEVPLIDGRIDEALWQQATVVEDLHEVRPNEFEAPSEETRFYVIYGDDAIYVAAEFKDSEPERMVAKVMRIGDSIPLGSVSPWNSVGPSEASSSQSSSTDTSAIVKVAVSSLTDASEALT